MQTFFVTVLALDFDDTIANSGIKEYWQFFADKGFDIDLVKETYSEIRNSVANSPRNLVTALSEKIEIEDQEGLIREAEKFHCSVAKPFPDSIPNINKWRERGIPVYILSYGDLDFQRRKIEAQGIPNDGIHVVNKQSEKLEYKKVLIEKHGTPLGLINDKATEFDHASSELENGSTIDILIYRPTISHNEIEGVGKYFRINSFDEIDFELVK